MAKYTKKLDLFDEKVFKTHYFPTNQYYPAEYSKDQIVLHHTVSGGGVTGDISWWKQTSSRIATSVIIDRKGIIHSCFDFKHWGHHLGVKSGIFAKHGIGNTYRMNEILNKKSIGVELDSWGGLVEKNGKWYRAKSVKNSSGRWTMVADTRIQIENKNVQIYDKPYRGFKGFEKYTTKQLNACGSLLYYLNKEFDIPICYDDRIWDVFKHALRGEKGLYTHTSYRYVKSDCHPQPELIKMIKEIETLCQS